MTFYDFGFSESLQQAIEDAGFHEPSPIQRESIPLVLKGKDLVGQAQTGTGKTAAFGLPILDMLYRSDVHKHGNVAAFVIVPTRELAIQVANELSRFGQYVQLKTATVYGGQPYDKQIRAFRSAHIIVATPGRLLDLLRGGKVKAEPYFMVLDEADEMLNMGFLEDVREIFSFFPKRRQNLLFSATLPKVIKTLIQEILQEPEFVTLSLRNITNEQIEQSFYVVDEHERDDALIRLYDAYRPTKSIIFCRTKKEVDRLSYFLIAQGYDARGLHGDIEQKNREAIIRNFRNAEIEILVATDLAARGLDINDVSHVFNYHLPFDSESYVHRIGRTGRAGKTGEAISIVTPHEYKGLQRIHHKTGSLLEARVIPHSSEIHDSKVQSFVEQVREQEVDKRAYDIIELLKEEYDLSVIAFKLISMMKDQVDVRGKAKIGKSANELQHFLSSANQRNNSSYGNQRSNKYKKFHNHRSESFPRKNWNKKR